MDALRKRVDENVHMLKVLAAGLEAASESRNTAQLDDALAQVRELSSAVRRRTDELPVAAGQTSQV